MPGHKKICGGTRMFLPCRNRFCLITLTYVGTIAAIQTGMNQTNYHFSVNGVAACQADETCDPRLDPCTTCSHATLASAEADAQRVRDLYPDADVRVHEGRCSASRTEYDYGYRDGYEAGLRAAQGADESLPE